MSTQKNTTPKRFLRSIFATQDKEITCPVCLDLLDVYVDKEITGADAAQLLPYVEQHLNCCNQCDELYAGLRLVLRDA